MSSFKVSNDAIELFTTNESMQYNKVYPVSVCGRSRIGKSTFLRHLFNLGVHEIKARAGDQVVTRGIDLLKQKKRLTPNLG